MKNELTKAKSMKDKSLTRKQLFDILEFLPDATFVVDYERKVIAWNRAIEEMTGVSKRNIIGKSDLAYSVPFYGRKRPILIDLVFAYDTMVEGLYDYVQRRGDTLFAEVYSPILNQGKGAFLWVTASPLFDREGNVVGAIEAVRDITDRKLMDDELHKHRNHLEELVRERTKELLQSEERFTKIFKASPTSMAISELADGRYLSVNDYFLEVMGYTLEEVIGHSALELGIWDNPEQRGEILTLLEEQGSFSNMEINFRTKNGQVLVGLYSGEIIELDGKKRLLSIVNNVTEFKQLQRDVEKLERLNLIGQMAAGIGHEIRNPMTTVRGFLQMLGAKQECIQYKSWFDLMIDELDRANSIITEYLSLAKKKMLNFKVQNLNAIIETISPLIEADALNSDKHVNFRLGTIPDLPLINEEIRQLILNIIRNGMEAMSSGGQMTVKTYAENEDVVMAIDDQGSGIEPEVLEKLGTPFFTTKEFGTGLGLAVCYSIAARHNAIINVTTGSEGTTFFVRFRYE